jgi:hypothetical protein
MLKPCSVCSISPPQAFSSMSSTYHSAMACLTLRVRIGVARLRAMTSVALGSASAVMPSSAASSANPGLLQLVLDLRAEVGDPGEPVTDSQTTATNRRSAWRASSSRSAMPPSRGTGTLNNSWASLCPRRSRLVRPDSTSQKNATMTQYGGRASRQRANCRGIDSVGSWLSLSDTRAANATGTMTGPVSTSLGWLATATPCRYDSTSSWPPSNGSAAAPRASSTGWRGRGGRRSIAEPSA